MGFDTVQPIKWNKFSKFDIKSHSKTHQKQLYFHLFYLSDKTCYKQASSSTEFQTVKIGYLDHFKKLNIADGITFTHWMVRVEEVASRAPRRQTVQLYLQHDQYWNRKQIVWFLCVCVCVQMCVWLWVQHIMLNHWMPTGSGKRWGQILYSIQSLVKVKSFKH